MKTLICLLTGHLWTPCELIHYLHFKRTGKVTGLYVRSCPRCFRAQWKPVTANKEK